jgi:hypothetical protein
MKVKIWQLIEGSVGNAIRVIRIDNGSGVVGTKTVGIDELKDELKGFRAVDVSGTATVSVNVSDVRYLLLQNNLTEGLDLRFFGLKEGRTITFITDNEGVVTFPDLNGIMYNSSVINVTFVGVVGGKKIFIINGEKILINN